MPGPLQEWIETVKKVEDIAAKSGVGSGSDVGEDLRRNYFSSREIIDDPSKAIRNAIGITESTIMGQAEASRWQEEERLDAAEITLPLDIREHAGYAGEALNAFMSGKSIPEVALTYRYEPGQAELFLRNVVRQYGTDGLRDVVPGDILPTLDRERYGFVDRESARRVNLQEERKQSAQDVRRQGYIDAHQSGNREYLENLQERNEPGMLAEVVTTWATDTHAGASSTATLLADAQIIQTELRDPATASEALESQAFSLERDMNVEAGQEPSTMESATLRSAADGVETGELTAAESREELAQKAEVYAAMVARDYRTATDTAVEKFADGLRNGSEDIDLSQAYEMPTGVSMETAQNMARMRHEGVGTALQPLFAEAESLGIRVSLGVSSAESERLEQNVSAKRGMKVA